MIKNNLRPYEISLWTLQDSFISVLKPLNLYTKGQIETPKIVIKDDGTQELTFKVPMYYYQDNKLVENPLWYDIKHGILMVNLRKIKVIFNKGEEGKEDIFEFIINKITETHENGQLYCEVSADGLAFQELGKVGYKISFNEDTFLNEYNEWWEKNKEIEPEPIANINYWCDKAFKNSKWTYEVQMDWSGFDGETENANRTENMRQPDKIYEEEYVSSWSDTESGLAPMELEPYKEKARIISIEKSNLYNITQTIAETFGVFCKYIYNYDENYHIIGRTCVFYNNFLNEKEGIIDINYPYDSSKIEREMDSTDVITKMFVVPVEDETSASGLITIADAAANKMKEDYILNFDYLYSIGTITQEQYDTIPDYERSMYNYNIQLIPLSTQVAKIETDLIDYKAQLTTATNGQIYDKEQMEQAVALMNAITGGDGELKKDKDTSYRAVLLQDEDNSYYVKITQEGVIENTIRIFYYKKSKDTSIEKTWTEYTGSYEIVKDENGNINRIKNLKLMEDTYSNIYYLTFNYRPKLFYENIYNTFAKQLAKDEAAEKEAVDKIAGLEAKKVELEERYNELLAEKNKEIADFENMMGPALKEGSWQADDYSDFGTNYKAIVNIGKGTVENAKDMSFVWDSELFDDEQLNYYEVSTPNNGLLTKEYFPCIDLTGQLEAIKNNIDDLTFIIPADETNNIAEEYCSIGSEMFYGFLLDEAKNNINPVLILTKNFSISQLQRLTTGYLGVVSSQMNNKSEIIIETKELIKELAWIGELVEEDRGDPKETIYAYWKIENYTWVVPRLEVRSLALKTNAEDFSIKCGNELLEKFYDYYILIKNDKYYITLKNNFIVSNGTMDKLLDVSFRISNAALSIYLDALEVSKNNAFPQVSYTIDVSARNEVFIKNAYKMLGRVVSINDSDLKFENVHGYISELELELDNFWEDKITIKNYKTKFEDLFSSIVASTEQMKSNSFSYDIAAGAFTSNGSIKSEIFQSTLNKIDLSYAFQNGKLTIDEENGIWATSDTGVVAMRGGGIFCATEKDSLGNWQWNTGITPSGINASLISAGQIDTNLIRIYAGDNLRFQMNGDGLLAYRSDSSGEAIADEYVIHNSEGLFLRQPCFDEEGNKKNELVDRVEISWNGLILRDNTGEQVFYADNNTGNLKIKGEITALSGKIGGWIIKDDYLQSTDGNAILRAEAPLEKNEIGEESKVFPYPMLYIEGDVNDSQSGKFKVESDGTLYANNAIIKGTLSAGSVIGNSTVDSVTNAIKKIEIVSFNGDCFRHYNPNLDGVITADPSWLRFQIRTNGLTKEELTDSPYLFYYCIPNDSKIDDEENNNWLLLNDSPYLEFEEEYLTFVIKDGIISNRGNLISLRIEKMGKSIRLKDGEAERDDEGHIIYEDHKYTDTILIRDIDYGTNKFLSLIDPPSYTFVGSQEIPYQDTAEFKVTLKNINANDGVWSLSNEEAENKNVLVGSETPKENSITKLESFIAVPEVILENGQWYIDDVLVQNGDTVVAEDQTTDLSSILITNTMNDDGTGTSTITVPHSKVPEGGQITLRYTIVDTDNNISATRVAFIFKIKNGVDSYLTLISSTAGTAFRNGIGETILEAELYAGITHLNRGDSPQYYYLWQKKDENEDTYTIINDYNLLESKTLKVSAKDIIKTASYICDIYDNKNEPKFLYEEKYGKDGISEEQGDEN